MNISASNFNDSCKHVTDQGYLVVPATLARTGIQEYLGSELDPEGRFALESEQIYTVMRYGEEVFSPEAIASFEGMPITLLHPPEREVTAKTWKEHSVGVMKNVRQQGEFLEAEAWIYAEDAISAVEEQQIKELSAGYDSVLEADGVLADFRQTQIRGNHVALVPKGRAGMECKLGDDEERLQMAKVKQGRFARLLDAIGIQLDKEQQEQVEELDREDVEANAQPAEKRDEDEKKPKRANVKAEDGEADPEKAELLAEIERLQTELDALKAEKAEQDEARTVANDALRIMPELPVQANDSARDIRTRFIVARGLDTAENLGRQSAVDIKALYQVAKHQGNLLGSALLNDATAASTKVDYNKLYRGTR